MCKNIKINYDKIPVHYCKTCLSLKIISLEGSNVEYCGKCGNTEVSKTVIRTWEIIYKEKYGKYYINS